MIEVNPIVLVCAVRYALGRYTYMPSVIAGEVMQVWNDLFENDKDIIMRDVSDFISSNEGEPQPFGGIDLETWVGLRDWMREQDAE